MWVKIEPLGDRGFWSMFPFTKATHFGVTLFLTHSQDNGVAAEGLCLRPSCSP